jgi:hypothetical protein
MSVPFVAGSLLDGIARLELQYWPDQEQAACLEQVWQGLHQQPINRICCTEPALGLSCDTLTSRPLPCRAEVKQFKVLRAGGSGHQRT